MAGDRVHVFVASPPDFVGWEVPVCADWGAQRRVLERAGAVVTVLTDDELIDLGLLSVEVDAFSHD